MIIASTSWIAAPIIKDLTSINWEIWMLLKNYINQKCFIANKSLNTKNNWKSGKVVSIKTVLFIRKMIRINSPARRVRLSSCHVCSREDSRRKSRLIFFLLLKLLKLFILLFYENWILKIIEILVSQRHLRRKTLAYNGRLRKMGNS